MAKMSDYPSVENTEEFTQEQKAAFLGSAMCIATGSKTAGGNKVTANIPLSDITPAVPTRLSDLTDDITVNDYDATSEAPISGKGVASALANFGGFIATTIGQDGKPVVEGIPDQKKIYLTPTGESGTENAYDEWICTDATVPTWEKVGVTRVNLSQYYTKTEADSAFVSKTGYGATDNNYTTTEKNKLDGIAAGADVNKIESISIGDTELVPDVNKNIDIGLGNWLDIDSNKKLYVTPNYGDGTGGLAYNAQYGELSVKFDKTTINRDNNDNLSVHYDDTLTIVDKPSGSLVHSYLSVANPVPTPAADHANVGMVLTVQQASDPSNPDEIVWAAPQGGTSIPTNPAFPANHSGGETFVLGITLEKDTSGTEPTYYWSDLKWIAK